MWCLTALLKCIEIPWWGELLNLSLHGSNNKLPELFSSCSTELKEIQFLKRQKKIVIKKKTKRFYSSWILSMKTYYYYFLKVLGGCCLVENGISECLKHQISFTQGLKYEHQDPTLN